MKRIISPREPLARSARLLLSAGTAVVAAIFPVAAWAQTDESAALETIRSTYRLPGLSAIVLKEGCIIAQGAAGVRRVGNAAALTVDDRLNFASCTKLMTATVVARLVDKGLIDWNLKIGDAFPESATFNPTFAQVTLDSLLAHRGGVQEQLTFNARHMDAFQSVTGSPAELRTWVCDAVLKDPPDVQQGTYLYSNLGYTLAARMMEMATGKSWEQLMDEEIFRPLRLKTAGMGITYTNDWTVPPTAPVGHYLPTGTTAPTPMEAPSENYLLHYQASNAPGGFVVCTLADYARFLHLFAGGESSSYLSENSRTRLLSPYSGTSGYARGVSNVRRDWAEPGPALNHTGEIFYESTTFWVAPAKDFAVVVFTNCRSRGDEVFYGTDAAAWQMISKYVDATPSGPCLDTPQVTASAKSGEAFTFSVQTLPAVTYHLERCADLQSGVWTEHGTALKATDWTTSFSVSSSLPREFFRVRVDP